MNSSYNTGYSAASGAPPYSPGIWQGVNTVFPSQPAGGLPGDRVPMSPYQQQQTSTPAPYKRPSFKLRKSIQPRQPLTILCELAGTKPHFDFYDVPYEERERRAWQMGCDLEDIGCYECRCSVQGMEFIGEGATKSQAKESVTEISIQGLISAKCEMNDVEGGAGNNEDNCPWPQIASLALYKLYNDWQSQGYELPRELTTLAGCTEPRSAQQGASGGPSSEGNFNHREVIKAPLQILNEMAGKMQINVELECVGEVGTPCDKVFTFSVRIKDKVYSGQAKSKKLAKQAAASSAIADQNSWYCPPVKHPPPPGDGDHEDQEYYEQPETVPPFKKKAIEDDEEMKKLYFGNCAEESSQSKAPKTVFKELEDKGALPGSHPTNI